MCMLSGGLISSPLGAVPPLDPGYIKTKAQGFKPCRTLPQSVIRELREAGELPRRPISGFTLPWRKDILVIQVQFAGGTGITETLPATTALFDKLSNYYKEVSYGIFTASVTVYPVRYTIGDVSNYNRDTDSDLQALINDTKAAAAAVDWSLYDQIMIYHEGAGEEVSRNTEDLWSLFYPYSFSKNGKTFNGFTSVPERESSAVSPLAVICHEYGHQLGLYDLYNTVTGRSTCGAWSLMDYPYGVDAAGDNPPHMDPWSRWELGFIDGADSSRTVTGNLANAQWGDIETSHTTGYYRIPLEIAPGEYFLVEWRSPPASGVVYDAQLPGAGLLVWHIDDAIALDADRRNANMLNTDPGHLGIDLIEAGGVVRMPPGSASDAFTTGSSFLSPQSDSFAGSPSGVAILDIMLGTRATAQIVKIGAASSFSLSEHVCFPNPAGKGYPHTRPDVLTTIRFIAPRPPASREAFIYTISGELVKHAQNNAIRLAIDRSRDFRWVYDFDWDGKNEQGEDVAPGLYHYLIRADNQKAIGKIIVQR